MVPCCYFKFNSPCWVVQIHGFWDTSERAFAAVIYMRSVYEDGSVEVVLMASKTCVAPTKRQTIPCLELLGAVLYWVVFRVVLLLPCWIQFLHFTERILWLGLELFLKQYISHRVAEIQSLTKCDQWQHCLGDCYPADIPSRGTSDDKLPTNQMWWKGPEFLQLPESQWLSADRFPLSEVTKAEIVKNLRAVTHVLVNTTDGTVNQVRLDEIKCTKYSSLNKLLRVTGVVLKFKNSLYNHYHQDEGVR